MRVTLENQRLPSGSTVKREELMVFSLEEKYDVNVEQCAVIIFTQVDHKDTPSIIITTDE